MKNTIFKKIFGGYLKIIILLAVLLFIFSLRVIKDSYINFLTRDLKDTAVGLRLGLSNHMENNDIAQVKSIVQSLDGELNERITVISSSGKVLADSEKNPENMDNHIDRPEVKEALSGKYGSSIRYSSTVKKEMLYVAVPVRSSGELTGIVRLSLYLSEVNDLINSLRNRILNVSMFIILVSIIFALFFSRTISNPIKKLTRSARRVADGDFNTRIFLKNKDELSDLAESFNYMTEKIGELFKDISKQKEELQGIIASLNEGIMIIDDEGKIKFGNREIKKIFQTERVKGRDFWEVIVNTEVENILRKAKKKTNYSKEITIDGEVYLCNVNYIEPRAETVIVFYNITKIKKLDKIKKDFVGNVSHELRTPLTAILGFSETLDEEITGNEKRYAKIIKKHTRRLINIVEDLLTLSGLESDSSRLKREKINLNNLIKDVLTVFDDKINEKELNIKINIDLPEFKADPFKLEQVFLNLMSNSVKYTPPGGEIHIEAFPEKDNIIVEFSDTGCGIPAKYRNRIFERFFVVDKSRSRKMGGTGLGLSIVKHIVSLHGGDIKMTSSSAGGTKFIISLPLL